MVELRTNLYDTHVDLGGKIVEFAGWKLPIQYKGISAEHEAVRERVGIFDVSHMGEIIIEGEDALKFVEYLCTNNISHLKDGKIVYTFFCRDNGYVVDDLLVYRVNEKKYFLVVNAANTNKDYDWIMENKEGFNVEVKNVSNFIGEVALQGPFAQKTLQKLTDIDLDEIKFFNFKEDIEICGVKTLISRTGYTGEDGFEIYTLSDQIVPIFKEILKAGEEYGIEPCGLGARDTLRFEAALPLYGHEISEEVNPIEGGFKFFVDLDKEDFIGKAALKNYYEAPKRKLVGLELKDKGIMREGYEVFKEGKVIGYVTTGYKSPTLNKAIANALLDIDHTNLGEEVEVKVRNKFLKAEIISKKFYDKKTKNK